MQAVNTLYTVTIGDSLSKLAAKFYGDAAKYPVIAERNNLQPTSILMIGQRLIIPPAASPVEEVQIQNAQHVPEYSPMTAPTGNLPVNVGIETITSTASVWYKDWRYWAAISAGLIVLWAVAPKLRR